MANSKYYNPHTFDPQRLDYQEDVRLAVRDELPDKIDSGDIGEYMYANMALTELVWPPIFFGAWAAFEPDVFYIIFITSTAHYSLSLGKRSFRY